MWAFEVSALALGLESSSDHELLGIQRINISSQHNDAAGSRAKKTMGSYSNGDHPELRTMLLKVQGNIVQLSTQNSGQCYLKVLEVSLGDFYCCR